VSLLTRTCTEDVEPPYIRPPLSKDLWLRAGERATETLAYTDRTGAAKTAWLPVKDDANCEWRLGASVSDLDVDAKAVLIGENEVVFFESCLLATGSIPRRVRTTDDDAAVDDDGGDKRNAATARVTTFRTAADYRRLESVSRDAAHVLVVGGGQLGVDLAAGLRAARGDALRVTLLVRDAAPLAHLLPPALSERVRDELLRARVDVRAHTVVRHVDTSARGDAGVRVHAVNADGTEERIDADHVVVAVGASPATAVASAAGLELDSNNGGVVVSPELAAVTGVYAAGDLISYYDSALKRRRRSEHHEHSMASGRVAGLNMSAATAARKPQRYVHQPVYSGGTGAFTFRAVGVVDAKLETVSVLDETARDAAKGVVYYIDKNRIVGIVLLNLDDSKVADARRVIERPKLYWSKSILTSLISIE
jgi:NADPH-dependent 2,4-dienoyl-CoA reductase/sulfur reductase-like enzyme